MPLSLSNPDLTTSQEGRPGEGRSGEGRPGEGRPGEQGGAGEIRINRDFIKY